MNGRRYIDLPWPLREVGALLDANAFHPGRSAFHHLLALAQTNAIPRSRVDDVLALVGLEWVAHKRAGTYSLGMAQRLGIAVALLGDPGVLLFDEPVNGLDPDGIIWVRTLLKRLASEGRTVFMSSHRSGRPAAARRAGRRPRRSPSRCRDRAQRPRRPGQGRRRAARRLQPVGRTDRGRRRAPGSGMRATPCGS